MKTRSIVLNLLMVLTVIVTAGLPGGQALAADTSMYRKPLSYRTLRGADSGRPVSVLRVRDQSASADDPSKYVLFSTPGQTYRGRQDFSLGKAYKPTDVTSLSFRVNYKGPASSTQVWRWWFFDWNARRWVKIGDNSRARAGVWKLLVFASPATPARFVNSNGRIRVLLTSSNASQNARIDYESLRVTVTANSSCTVQENSAFEAEVLSLLNAERAKVNAGPLTSNDKLDAAAQRHSNDMACNNFMSHTGSDGSSPWDRMSQAGYSYSMAAENVAAGYSTPASVVTGWMNSPGHRDNILNAGLQDIGIAYAYKDGTTYGHYWTTDFGTQP